jgi:MFS family permease
MTRQRHVGLLAASAAALVVAIFAPVALAPFAPWPNLGIPWAVGAFSSGIAAFLLPWPRALAVAAVNAAVVALAIVVGQWPVAGGLYLALLCAAVGWSSLRGLHPVAIYVALLVCVPLILPPSLESKAHDQRLTITPGHTAELFAIVLVAGAWTVLVVALATRRRAKPAAKPLTPRRAFDYGACLAVAGGIAAFVALEWFHGEESHWLPVSALVVLGPLALGDPSLRSVLEKGGYRVLGTVIGVALAGTVAVAVTNDTAQLWIGVAFLAAGVVAIVSWTQPSQYWRGIALMTPAVVLLGSFGNDTLSIDGQRLLFTLAGSALAMVTVVVGWLATR